MDLEIDIEALLEKSLKVEEEISMILKEANKAKQDLEDGSISIDDFQRKNKELIGRIGVRNREQKNQIRLVKAYCKRNER